LQPEAAVRLIRNAMMRLDPTLGTFTANHNLVLQLCLASGQFEEALPLLDAYIHSFPSESNHGFDGDLPCSNFLESSGYLTVSSGLVEQTAEYDVALYFLMGAMLYLGMGPSRYDDALMYLEVLVTMPTQNVASGLMLEAYRKKLLLNLLRHGKVIRYDRSRRARLNIHRRTPIRDMPTRWPSAPSSRRPSRTRLSKRPT
jgi:COP9 signalosome complex subunit 3